MQAECEEFPLPVITESPSRDLSLSIYYANNSTEAITRVNEKALYLLISIHPVIHSVSC